MSVQYLKKSWAMRTTTWVPCKGVKGKDVHNSEDAADMHLLT